jgi:hypothetical protein
MPLVVGKIKFIRENEMVPDGYDLFGVETPHSIWKTDTKLHPLYQTFLKKAREVGFAIESAGFQGYEDTYFAFFLLGTELDAKNAQALS